MKEIKLEIPDGYEVDKDKSTFEKIILKEKCDLPTYYDECSVDKHYRVTSNGLIEVLMHGEACICNDSYSTKKIADGMIALQQLLWLRDKYRASEEGNKYPYGIYIGRTDGVYGSCSTKHTPEILSFQTEELRDKFKENFKDLIKQFAYLYE